MVYKHYSQYSECNVIYGMYNFTTYYNLSWPV